VEDAQGGFGNVDLPDFNMGAFNPYPAQHAWSHTRWTIWQQSNVHSTRLTTPLVHSSARPSFYNTRALS